MILKEKKQDVPAERQIALKTIVSAFPWENNAHLNVPAMGVTIPMNMHS